MTTPFKNVLDAALTLGILASRDEAPLIRTLPLRLVGGVVDKKLAGIDAFESLRVLDIVVSGPVSLAPLKALKNLESLTVTGGVAKDLDALAELPSLRHLRLVVNRQKNLDGLASASLKSITADDCGISSLDGLGDLPKLRWLSVARNGLKALPGLPSLEYLDVSTTKVKSLEELGEARGLEHLRIDGTTIKDLGPLSGNENLVTFSSTLCKSLRSLEGLRSPALRSLVVAQTKVKDLSPVDVSKLEYLNIVGTRATYDGPLPAINPAGSIFGKEIQVERPTSQTEREEVFHWLRFYTEPRPYSLSELPASETLKHLVVGCINDPKEYALDGVERFPRLRTLKVRGRVESFEPLERAKELRSLLSGAPADGNIDRLAELPLVHSEVGDDRSPTNR